MSVDITVTIGGEAGQGIQTVGDLLSQVCQKAGLYVMAVNDFESRIRGGHSFVQIRISDHEVFSPRNAIALLIALDQETVNRHQPKIIDGGLILSSESIPTVEKPLVTVEFEKLAEQAGGKITANTVAAGACLGLLKAPFDLLKDVLADRFGGKDAAVLEKNVKAAELGYQAVSDTRFGLAFDWEQRDVKGVLINGSRAIALGALAANCRFAAFYPMSPATGVIRNITEMTDQYPFVVEQAEDEIAAVNMIIGAAFAGVRSMTSTSGGGFCLMTEGLGLAGITEVPIVIVNAQRPGPATGLPTRTAQGDLLFVINASQDEFPRFVFAPRSVNEAFYTMIRAFELSEKYQVPAIILSDQFFNDSVFISKDKFIPPENIQRFIATDADLDDPNTYRRFAVTQSGVSPRVLPCRGNAIIATTGNEHLEDGHISEDKDNRTRMVNKRNAKLPAMTAEMNGPEGYFEDADILLIGWGSSAGAIKEAVDILRARDVRAGCLTFSDIWPFPAGKVVAAAGNNKTLVSVELNSTAQFTRLIRQQTGIECAGSILKYDGRPLYPEDVVDGIDRFL